MVVFKTNLLCRDRVRSAETYVSEECLYKVYLRPLLSSRVAAYVEPANCVLQVQSVKFCMKQICVVLILSRVHTVATLNTQEEKEESNLR